MVVSNFSDEWLKNYCKSFVKKLTGHSRHLQQNVSIYSNTYLRASYQQEGTELTREDTTSIRHTYTNIN